RAAAPDSRTRRPVRVPPLPPRVLEARHLPWHGDGRVVSYHAEHPTAAGGEDGALLAPHIRDRPVEDRPLARAHRPSRHVPRTRTGQLPSSASAAGQGPG